MPDGGMNEACAIELAGECLSHSTRTTNGDAGQAKCAAPPRQIEEYGRGARNRAVFFDVASAYWGKSLIFIHRGSGPNFFQALRCVARSGPDVM